jgi:hypothetical protein
MMMRTTRRLGDGLTVSHTLTAAWQARTPRSASLVLTVKLSTAVIGIAAVMTGQPAAARLAALVPQVLRLRRWTVCGMNGYVCVCVYACICM